MIEDISTQFYFDPAQYQKIGISHTISYAPEAYFSIETLAAMAGVTPEQFFEILLECSHVANDNGKYAVASSGAELGGIDLPGDIHNKYEMIFPIRLLNDPSVQEGIEEIKALEREKQKASIANLLREGI